MLIGLRSFFMALFPMLSSFYATRKKDFRKASRKAIRYLIIAVIPLAILVTLFSPKLFPFILGDKYDASAVIVVQVIIWSLIPFAITEVFDSVLLASNHQNKNLILKTIALLIKAVLNYFFILKYGIMGPALATVFSLFILLIIQIPFIIPNLLRFQAQHVIIPGLKLILASMAMIVFLYLMNQQGVFINIFGASLVYLASLYLLKIVTKDDKVYFNRIIHRKKMVHTI
jgi:O-antigen/teichoic acid export membrane protein